MNDTEKVISFGEMADAVNKLSAPWRKAFFAAIGALIAVMVIMGSIIFYMVHCAYAEPTEVITNQTQDFQGQQQHSNSSVTSGK